MALTTQSATAQYSIRPADETFRSLEDLREAAYADARICRRANVPLSGLEAVVDANGADVALKGRQTGTVAQLTNWSFSQLCRLVSAPASYLRNLPPALAVDNLNHGLAHTPGADADGGDAQLYIRRNGTTTLRAITSQTYARYPDAYFVDRLLSLRDRRPALQLPPVWDKDPAGHNLLGGAYRGDRDCYVILVDGGSIVNDPTISFGGSNGQMFRGVIARNSEVGGAKLELISFLFRGICGNHNIWGVQDSTAGSRRHVGTPDAVSAAFDQMIAAAVTAFDRPASEDEARIRQLAAIELGKDRDEVVTAGRSAGLTEEASEASFTAAEEYEANPRSIWGFANGITRVSQLNTFSDARLEMDLVAAKLLRRKVAA